MAWKKRKEDKLIAELEEKMKQASAKTGGKGNSVLSGRALFKFDPNLFMDDAEAVDEVDYEDEDSGNEEAK